MHNLLLLCSLIVALSTGRSFKISTVTLKKYSYHSNVIQLPAQSGISAMKSIKSLRGGSLNLLNDLSITFSANTPSNLFNSILAGIMGTVLLCKSSGYFTSDLRGLHDPAVKKPKVVRRLQAKFLSVFWLLRMADWLQGPYFFEVFNTKIFNSVPASPELVAKIFLLGFATTGLIGPILGRYVDIIGRKRGTLLFALLYVLSALSTTSDSLPVILLGRLAGGLGTSLLFSAPEAWLMGEYAHSKIDAVWLGETFGWAFAGDAVVAILAGHLATVAAKRAGPSGPFMLSVVFLVAGAALTMCTWDENTAASVAKSTLGAPASAVPHVDVLNPGLMDLISNEAEEHPVLNSQSSVKSAIDMMFADKKIILLGAVQALFEAAMYTFVLQWPPLMREAILASSFGSQASVPYGTIFSCFMASCLFGSALYGKLQKKGVAVEKSTTLMLLTATAALSAATYSGSSSLIALSAALFVFEACVGMYFPSIGSLRSRYLPDQHRSIMMNLFGVPLNLFVVSIVLGLKYIGTKGALSLASVALGVSAMCMFILNYMVENNSKAELRNEITV